MSISSIFVQAATFNLRLRYLSTRDVDEARELFASPEKDQREGEMILSLIMNIVILVPSGIKAKLLPTKGVSECSSKQMEAWNLLGLDDKFLGTFPVTAVHVSVQVNCEEFVLEYPLSLLLKIVDLPQLAATTKDYTHASLLDYFPLLRELATEFHSFAICDNILQDGRNTVDFWDYHSPDAFLCAQTISEIGKSESVISKHENRNRPQSSQVPASRRGPVGKKNARAKQGQPPVSRGVNVPKRYFSRYY